MNHSLSSHLLLQSCQSLRSLKQIHARLLIEGLIPISEITLNRLIRVSSRLGHIDYAHKVFQGIPEPNSFLWTALIHGHVENRYYDEALFHFRRMQRESIPPLNFTLSSILKALSRQMRLRDGEIVYGLVLKLGFDSDSTVQNTVLDFFSRCSEVDIARRVFDEMPDRDVISWNSMISCYGNHGRVDDARELFEMMLERTVVSWTALICAYVRIGDMEKARACFEEMPMRDVASWKVMVSGYIDAGDLDTALYLFERMPNHDISSWNLMLSGFCKACKLEHASDMFNRMPRRNVASWVIMIDGYIKVGDVSNARVLFDEMPEKNLVSWSTMIAGYAKNAQCRQALDLFKQFKEQRIEPDETFILGIVSACSQLGVLNTAEEIVHEYVQHNNLSNLQLLTSLIDMYSKCGSVEKALQVFENANRKDLICYSTMIAAFANHGMGQEAIALFEDMLMENIKPDGVTFLGVLTACNHSGFLDKGKHYFKLMVEDFSIQPSERHYACMVDLLGRARCLDEAYKLMRNMHVEPRASAWGSLLAACRVHCNVELAEVSASWLFEIEPDNSGNYVLLCNIYAAAERWDDVAKVRAMIREGRVRKNRGSSWIELGNAVHEFVAGDASHFCSESIYDVLNFLFEDMMTLDDNQNEALWSV